jgi:hypothetical protein
MIDVFEYELSIRINIIGLFGTFRRESRGTIVIPSIVDEHCADDSSEDLVAIYQSAIGSNELIIFDETVLNVKEQ